jgi:cobalt-zinc-cadmium efflux system outer membrane protein
VLKRFVLALSLFTPAAAAGDDAIVFEPVGESSQSGPAIQSTPTDAPQPTLTLADLEQIALTNNPTLSRSAADVNGARGQFVQAGLYPNPVIGYSGSEIGDEGTAGDQGGYVAQRFITGGKLRLDQAMAARQVEESQFLLNAQEQRVLSDVRIRFYDALVAERRMELTQNLARIADDLTKASQTLLEAGQATENSLLQAEIEAQQAHVRLDNARNELSEARRRLAAVVGLPTLPATSLAGDLTAEPPERSWEDLYAALVATSPELAAARKRAERAQIAVVRARREIVPNLDLMVTVMHMNASGDDGAGVQAGIPIPIANANQGNISRAEAEVVAAQNDILRVELNLQERLAAVYRQYANARQQAKRFADSIVPRSSRSLDLVVHGYRQGQVDYMTLITSQRTYVEVHLAYLEALRALRTADALIEGQLLSGSLEAR